MTRYLLIAIGVLTLLLGGTGYLLKRSIAAEAVMRDALQASEDTVKHMQKDAADTARIVGAYAAEIATLQEAAADDRVTIIRAPVTTGCADRPAIRAAIRSRLPSARDGKSVR